MKKDTKKWVPASEKLGAINDYLSGLGNFHELAKLYNVSHVTVMNWANSKDDIINECKACAIMFPNESQQDSIGAIDMDGNRNSSREAMRQIIQEEKRLKHRIAYLESLLEVVGVRERDISKKRYLAIQNASLASEIKFNVSLFCSVADISRESYYQYLKQLKNGNVENNKYIKFITEVQNETGFGVGYRRMTARINRKFDVHVNTKRVRRFMDENDKLSVVRRKKLSEEQYKRRREQKDNIPKDLLKMNFFFGIPRKIFVEDITYIYTFEQMFYLNTIEDLFNKEIVAWCIGLSPNADLCVSTVMKLKEVLGSLNGIILHSDIGSTYTSYKYRDCLRDFEIIQSCSKGSCFYNAAMESFNGIYKTEGAYNWFGKTKYLSRRIRYAKVLEKTNWFIPYYNNIRLKEELGFLSPVKYLNRNPKGTLPMIIQQP